ncbi:MAG: hypothetical protein HFI64_04155 [Lachnospiraceae bacterium]|nr:hypothetical protein [Lachnospiraceae bacterium]
MGTKDLPYPKSKPFNMNTDGNITMTAETHADIAIPMSNAYFPPFHTLSCLFAPKF